MEYLKTSLQDSIYCRAMSLKDGPEWWKRLRERAHPYKAVLALASSGIVLLTFIVRDEARDRLREDTRSAEAALSRYDADQERFRLMTEVRGVREGVDDIQHDNLMKNTTAEDGDFFSAMNTRLKISNMAVSLSDEAAFASSLSRTSEELGGESSAPEVAEWLAAAEECTQAQDEIEAVFAKWESAHEAHRAAADEVKEQTYKAFDKYFKSFNVAVEKQSKLSIAAYKRALETQRRSARRYRIVTWASYGLFGIGWFFGLLSIAAGGDAKAE